MQNRKIFRMNSLDCSAQAIVKATVYTLLEQKREAEGVSANYMKEMEQK